MVIATTIAAIGVLAVATIGALALSSRSTRGQTAVAGASARSALPTSTGSNVGAQPVPPGQTSEAAEAGQAAAVDKQRALKTLRSYYGDFNAGRFDANRYFAPSVALYITMKNTTPGKINQYMTGLFPKQFENFHAAMDESSLAAEGSDTFVYRQSGQYYQVAQQKFHNNSASVRVRFDPAGGITYFEEFAVVEQH